MTYEQIETFLAVAANGNITAAAERLFVSQSTVSNRIQALEDELDAQLMVRKKGHRNVEMTPYGTAFAPVASQWAVLWKETRAIKERADIQTLTIASVDAVNNYTLVPLFNRLIAAYPSQKLAIHTHHSNEIHTLVESRAADVGFVFSRISYPNLVSRPVYRELMYLICHKDSGYYDGISCEALDPAQEIYLRWGPDYEQWHDMHWSPDRHPLVSVNTGSTLQRFLHVPGRWAVAPMSVIHAMSHNTDLVYYKFKDPPTPRICYEITNRYPTLGHQDAIETFDRELDRFIAEDGNICTFEPWMLPQ